MVTVINFDKHPLHHTNINTKVHKEIRKTRCEFQLDLPASSLSLTFKLSLLTKIGIEFWLQALWNGVKPKMRQTTPVWTPMSKELEVLQDAETWW